MHSCHNLKLLPWVWTDFFIVVKNRAAVSSLALCIVTNVTVLGHDIIVIATGAACVSLPGESRAVVDKEKSATGLHVLLH